MNEDNKLQLNLNESNKLKFELQIEGNIGELDDVVPVVRFTINEEKSEKSNKGWIFGLSKDNIDNDQITIDIPSMKGLVKENRVYDGKLEVILGSNYFVPTETKIQFIEPIKVEAQVLTTKPVLKESTRVKCHLIKEEAKKPVIVSEQQTSKTTKPTLSEDSRKKIYETFLTECERLQIDDPIDLMKSEGNEVLKKFVKDIFKTSVKSIIS